MRKGTRLRDGLAVASFALLGACSTPSAVPPVQSLNAETCIDWTRVGAKDTITKADWQRAVGTANVAYFGSTEYLSTTEDGWLVQRLSPENTNGNGTKVVSAGIDIAPARALRLSQTVRFDDGFVFGGQKKGGKLGYGVGAGTVPTGGQRFGDGYTSRIMWRGPDGDARGPNELTVYAYSADRTMNLPWGDDFPIRGFEIEPGQSFVMVQEIVSNTLGPDGPQADGSVRVTIDGRELLYRDKIRWQDEGDSAINRVMYSTFYGGQGADWSPPFETQLATRDVCWSALDLP